MFVHGCFWHSHEGCRFATKPRTRADFWEAKLQRNIERDRENVSALSALGWQTYTVWECSLKEEGWLQKLVADLGPSKTRRG
ncbi:MAG: mismatch endonuclease Vsr [Massilia sp.]|nr:mismatch endonuclease Vsr [Massilia sp.]